MLIWILHNGSAAQTGQEPGFPGRARRTDGLAIWAAKGAGSMLNRLPGAPSTVGGASPVAAQVNPGECGTARAGGQKPAPCPIRARRTLGRSQPQVVRRLCHATPLASRRQMTTNGSVSTIDWQGGIHSAIKARAIPTP